MVEACHVQEVGAGSTATRPPRRSLRGRKKWSDAISTRGTGCQLDLVALPQLWDLLLRAKHLFLLPWWLAARSPRQGAWEHAAPHAHAVAAVAENLAWWERYGGDEQMLGAKQQIPHEGKC
jgi:hypothetical protein